MKILMMTPGAIGFESPSVYVARELAARGHHVDMAMGKDGMTPIIKGSYDVVYGDMERSCIPAYLSAITLGLPCYLHGEWVPIHRVTMTNEWGPGCINSEEDIKKWSNFYKPIAAVLHEADICSWGGQHYREFAEQWLERKYTNCFSKYPELPQDVPTTPYPASEAEHAVVIVARLAPVKRVPDLVEAVGMMKMERKPKVYIVGDGPERPLVLATARKYGLDIELAGAISGEEKWDFIRRGRVMLAAWSGIPPAEAAFAGRMTISYDSKYMRELYPDLFYLAENTVENMAVTLDRLFAENPEEHFEYAHEIVDRILSGTSTIKTLKHSVDIIEDALGGICR